MEIGKLILKMTTKDKILLLSGASMWKTEAIERLGIPSVILTDGPHGLRLGNEKLNNTQPATAFPVEAAMAATWNINLINRVGRTIAEECQYYDVGVILGPGVNGKRSPLGGRNFEYFSEDPYLSGTIGAAYVEGVQSGGVGTSVKHFVANEQEKNRMAVSSEVDERTLREIYLLPFEMIVRQAKPWTVMCSYNKLNGVKMSGNLDYLQKILKDEWGFDGLVMSDWGAVSDKIGSVKGGLDLEMPGPGKNNDKVIDAYNDGIITDEELNSHVTRFLRLIDRIISNQRDVQRLDFEKHHTIARECAEESFVLLKNSNSILPLRKGIKMALIGDFAVNPRFQGGGSSKMNPSILDSPMESISSYSDVSFLSGFTDEELPESQIEDALAIVKGKDVIVIFTGTTDNIESEGYDRQDIKLPEIQLKLIRRVSAINSNIILVNHSGSAIDLSDIEQEVQAILHVWLPGQAGGSAIARCLFGEINPSGKLSETFPLKLEHNPSFTTFPGDVNSVEYDEKIFTGYRHYDKRKLPVKYEFGYGLSYTKFEYSNFILSHNLLKKDDVLRVKFDITNTGKYRGKETAQLYVQDLKSSVPKAVRELKGFVKTDLKAGETKTVEIKLTERAFCHYVPHKKKFMVESGEFKIVVGASSRDIRLSDIISFSSDDETREPLTLNNELRDWIEDDRYSGTIEPIFNRIIKEVESPVTGLITGMPLETALLFLPLFGVSEKSLTELRDAIDNYIRPFSRRRESGH